MALVWFVDIEFSIDLSMLRIHWVQDVGAVHQSWLVSFDSAVNLAVLFVCLFVLWLFNSGGTVVCRLPVVIEWCWEKPIFFNRLYNSESVVYSGSFPKVLDVPFLKNIFSLLVKVEFHTFQSIFSRSVSVSQIEKLFPHSFLEKNCGRFRGITYLMCRTETYLTLLKELKSKVARVNDPRGQISYTKEGKKRVRAPHCYRMGHVFNSRAGLNFFRP